MELLKKSCNPKGSLVFCPYHWKYGVKAFSGSSNIQRGWKDYQGVIHNTYFGGHIETDHYFMCLIPEDVENKFALPNVTTPVTGTLMEVLENGNTPRDKISLNRLGMKKVKCVNASMMLKRGMEVDQY